MPAFTRTELADLAVFAAVLRRRSFKAAAIELGVTTSAVSHTIRRLETRLDCRLLARTSRTVAPTPVGTALAERLEAGFGEIGAALDRVASLRSRPLGALRLNVPRDAARLLLQPALPRLAERFPELALDVVVENRPVDIVAEGYDAGIRFGDTVPQDMVAVALTPPLSWVVVGSPGYLRRHGRPERPEDLLRHRCLRLMLGDNTRFRWELGAGEAMVRLDVPGPHAINDTELTVAAAVDGLGLAYVLRRRVERECRDGALEVVLPDWASPGAGYQLYYPSRRHAPAALRPLAEIIRGQNGLEPIPPPG